VIAPSDLSANGLALLRAFPDPNAAGATYNWVDSATEKQTQRKDTVVIDFIPYDAHRIRFTILNYNYTDYTPHYGNFNRNPRIFTRPNQIGVLHYDWTVSPSLVNELVVSAAADHVNIDIDRSSGFYDRTKYGITYPYLYSASTKTIPNKIPTVSLPNFDLLDGGPYPSRSGGMVYNLADNVTKVLGNHTLKAGFNFEYSGENNFDQITVSNTQVRTYDLLRKSTELCGTTRPAAKAPPLHLGLPQTAILRGWRDLPSRRVRALPSAPCSRLLAGSMWAVCRASSPLQTATATTLNRVKQRKRDCGYAGPLPFPALFTVGVCSSWRLASCGDLPPEHEADLAFGGPVSGSSGGVPDEECSVG